MSPRLAFFCAPYATIKQPYIEFPLLTHFLIYLFQDPPQFTETADEN